VLVTIVLTHIAGALLLAVYLRSTHSVEYTVSYQNYVGVALFVSLCTWFLTIQVTGWLLGSKWLMEAIRKASRTVDEEIREEYGVEPTFKLRARVMFSRTVSMAFTCAILGGLSGWLIGAIGNLSEPCFAIGFMGAFVRACYQKIKFGI